MDEFVLGDKDAGNTGSSYDGKKKIAITVIKLKKNGKIKQMYAMKIEDSSAKSLQYIFVNHISR